MIDYYYVCRRAFGQRSRTYSSLVSDLRRLFGIRGSSKFCDVNPKFLYIHTLCPFRIIINFGKLIDRFCLIDDRHTVFPDN